MHKFLIEVPHGATKAECEHAIQVFKESGSHFLTHADWGCGDGVHKAWFIADVESRREAIDIIPPYYRESATVVQLMKLSSEEEMAGEKYHEP